MLALSSIALGLAATWALARRAAAPPLRLAWDGAAWVLHPDRGEGLRGAVTVMVDLDGWMLVRFTPGDRWLPLSRRNAADWQALRVALHAVPRRPGA